MLVDHYVLLVDHYVLLVDHYVLLVKHHVLLVEHLVHLMPQLTEPISGDLYQFFEILNAPIQPFIGLPFPDKLVKVLVLSGCSKIFSFEIGHIDDNVVYLQGIRKLLKVRLFALGYDFHSAIGNVLDGPFHVKCFCYRDNL